MTERDRKPVTRRIAGHILISDPAENVRVWQQLATIVCHAPVHDTLDAYNRTCRCPAAVAEQSRYQKRRQRIGPALIDADLAGKQLRALAAIGYRLADVAPHVGIVKTNLVRLRDGRQPRAHKTTVAAIERFYRDHRNTPGPSPLCAARAQARGWQPPSAVDLVHIDDVKVRRAIEGVISPRTLNAAERLVVREQSLFRRRNGFDVRSCDAVATDTPADSKRQESA